jgi:isocitrate lyase
MNPLDQEAQALRQEWQTNPRWRGIRREYRPEDVVRLRPSLLPEQTLARHGAEKLWKLLHERPYLHTFGAYTGAMAVEMVRAGLEAIYLSGWQVAADANLAWQTYPDQSLYPASSGPQIVRRIQNALMRADQIERAEGQISRDWYVPIVADAEAGFGGPLNAFELTKAFIEAGAAAIHYEDQLASEKKCGHLGGKVLVPTRQHIRTLQAARLAADILGVPTVIIARTDAEAATLITSNIDEYDRPFILPDERTPEGFYAFRHGLEAGIARALAYAPYADILWMETSHPDLHEARRFAEAVKREFPDRLLAYNLSPSFNWRKFLDEATIRRFNRELGAMGYAFQFVTLAGWHALNYSIWDLARRYKDEGMPAFVELQTREFQAQSEGFTAIKHQREVGASYFDEVLLSLGQASTLALKGSTEEAQFSQSLS